MVILLFQDDLVRLQVNSLIWDHPMEAINPWSTAMPVRHPHHLLGAGPDQMPGGDIALILQVRFSHQFVVFKNQQAP